MPKSERIWSAVYVNWRFGACESGMVAAVSKSFSLNSSALSSCESHALPLLSSGFNFLLLLGVSSTIGSCLSVMMCACASVVRQSVRRGVSVYDIWCRSRNRSDNGIRRVEQKPALEKASGVDLTTVANKARCRREHATGGEVRGVVDRCDCQDEEVVKYKFRWPCSSRAMPNRRYQTLPAHWSRRTNDFADSEQCQRATMQTRVTMPHFTCIVLTHSSLECTCHMSSTKAKLEVRTEITFLMNTDSVIVYTPQPRAS